MVVECCDSLPVRCVLKPKSSSFFLREPELFQETLILTFFEFLGGTFVQNTPNIAFFNALCANISNFEINDGNFTTSSLSILGRIGNSYQFVKFGPKKVLSF